VVGDIVVEARVVGASDVEAGVTGFGVEIASV
jgi:hypothetical protein